MRLSLFLYLITVAVSVPALSLHEYSGKIEFGTKELLVVFNGKNGTLEKVVADGKTVLEHNRFRIPFDVKLEAQRMLGHIGPEHFRLTDISRKDDNTLVLTIKAENFTVKAHWRLLPEQRMLQSSYELSGPADRTVKVYGFRENLPDAVFSEKSYYRCPGLFPGTGKRSLRDLRPGRVIQNWRDPCPTIIQLDPERSVLTLQDRTRPYADIGRTEITERETGLSLAQTTESSGFLRPGEPWRIGDFHCLIRNDDGDGTLRGIHDWMKLIGMTVPADRNPDIINTILYSFHPGMPGHPFRDWGGFSASTGQLSRIRQLNCNTVWILPVESECPYIPDDYYRMANGIGTPEEYGKLVESAQRLGMKTWQDVVPHGGRNSNRRALEHPGWLLRDETGKVPRVRCFDYNNAEWQDYLREVVRFYTQTYRLDGWRIDTSGFSMIPNWSDSLPYNRASWAMGQGGLGMMRALRKGAKEANPAAVTLGECDGSIYGTAADAVYDFPLCREVFKSILTLPPEQFVRELTVWLHEQKHTELKDLIRLRYVESHDEPRAELLYGPEPMRAGIALVTWIHGIPMIYKEMEDGHSAIFRRILGLRETLPELSGGDAIYPGCTVTPGVFACLRRKAELLSIPLINFNPVPVKATLSIPSANLPESLRSTVSATELWNGTPISLIHREGSVCAEVELPAYGFTVLRFGMAATTGQPRKTAAEPDRKPFPLEAFRLDDNGNRTRIEPFNPAMDGEGFEQLLDGNSALMFRIPLEGASAVWRVRSAAGTLEDVFRTRHPFYNAKLNNMYSLPSGHNVLWSSVTQPFGFTEDAAEIAIDTNERSVRFSFPPENRPGAVFLLDRIGEDHNPWLVLVKRLPDSPLATAGNRVVVRLSRTNTMERKPPETGDSRLIRIAGGWMFDNGKIRLRIASNGTLTGWWTQEKNGCRKLRMSNLRIELESGYAGKNGRFSSVYEMEAFSLLEKRRDGTLLLRFFGRPRGRSYYDILPPNSLNYLMAYTLNDSGAFGFTAGVRPVTEAPEERMRLALAADFPAGGTLLKSPEKSEIKGPDGFVFFSETTTAGEPPEQITMENGLFSCDWFLHHLPEKGFGVWRTFSAIIGTKDSGEPPAPWREIPNRPASDSIDGLLDPSFEFDCWGAFPDTVQMYAYAFPWQMPFGSTVDSIDSADGSRSAKIVFGTTGEDQRLRQRLTGKWMRPGEIWRLSALVKADGLDYGNARNTAELRLHSNGGSAAVSFPDGNYDWREFSVDFPVPAKLNGLEIQIGGKAESGTLRIDHLRMERITETSQTRGNQ